jgi:hypothetical protein
MVTWCLQPTVCFCCRLLFHFAAVKASRTRSPASATPWSPSACNKLFASAAACGFILLQ